MSLAIVTDSTASLTGADVAAWGVHVVPISVMIGTTVHTEGVDVSADMIAQALRSGTAVSTSRPSAEAFETVYRDLAATGVTEIVSVHLSSKISGTIESAELAARRSPVPVHVVDTWQVGMGTGFAAIRAARAAAAGAGVDDVVAAAMGRDKASSIFLYVDSLEFLKRGGRIGPAAALIGSALAVKPILTLVDGVVTPLEKVRTTNRALARLVVLATEMSATIPGEFDAAVQHLAAEAQAAKVASQLAAAWGLDAVRVDEIGAALGAHVGPGMIGITVTER